MVSIVLYSFSLLILLVLGIFSCRRLFFILTAVLTKVDEGLPIAPGELPPVTVLIPCHNEERVIGKTLESLLHLDYPEDRLEIVVIDDCSSDATLEIAQRYENRSGHIHTYKRSETNKTRGKAAAINEALERFSRGEVVYFIDADHRLRPDALARLIRHFRDEKTGAVSGRCIPRNKYDALISGYVYVESLVHHRVTMYASDRLNLAPSVLGSNFCIRRDLLEKIGLFDEERLTEDLDLTVKIYKQGCRVKYDVTSISEHEAPNTIKGYLYQHLRWNRGYNQVARSHAVGILGDRGLPLLRRVELTLSSLGYLDRLFFLGALCLALVSLLIYPRFNFPLWVLPAYLAIPLLEIIVGLVVTKNRLRMFLRLPGILLLFPVDVYVALIGYAQDISKKPATWYKTQRVGDDTEINAR